MYLTLGVVKAAGTTPAIGTAVNRIGTILAIGVLEGVGSQFQRHGYALVKELERQMKQAAKELDFERAALLRDQVTELRRELIGGDSPDSLRSLAANTQRPTQRRIRGGRTK